jgi:hypothetical protein
MAGTMPRGVAIADFNMDGKNDVVVSDSSGSKVHVYCNTTAFAPAPTSLTFALRGSYDVASGAWGVAATDMNGDGWPDIVVTNSGFAAVTVLMNKRDASHNTIDFPVPHPSQRFAVGNSPQGVSVLDLNGDGRLDVAVANNGSGNVSVLLNKTATLSVTPTFDAKVDCAVGSGPTSGPVAVRGGEINSDGKPDLVVTNQASNNVSVLLNSTGAMGSASFASQATVGVGAAPSGLAVLEIHGDGHMDIAVPSSSANNFSVFRNSTNP